MSAEAKSPKITLIDFSGIAGKGATRRDPMAAETQRRQRLLAAYDADDPNILEHSNGMVRHLIREHIECLPDMRRNRDDTKLQHWAQEDAERLHFRGRLDWRDTPAALAINATAGLGKSYAFLENIADQCMSNEHVTAAILSPTHALSEQSFALFRTIAQEKHEAEAADFARVFIAIDEGCKRTCRRKEDFRPESKRKFMAGCGVGADGFCKRKERNGDEIYAGCPYQFDCNYWQQFENADRIRVWFHTHAAAKSGSLRAAGIATRFDVIAIDENLLGLFTDQEEIDLSVLPLRERDSELQMVEEGVGGAISYAPQTVRLRAAVEEFLNTHADGSERSEDGTPVIHDGNAFVILTRELLQLRETFERLVNHTLRADPGDFEFNTNGDTVRDFRTQKNKVTLETLAKQRVEAKTALLVCELLLSFHPGGRRCGYSHDPRTNAIILTRKTGFADHAHIYSPQSEHPDKIARLMYDAEAFEQAWCDYETAVLHWRGRKKFIRELNKEPMSYFQLNDFQLI